MQVKTGVLVENCCECGNCVNKCPKGAISWEEETLGCKRATVNQGECIGCGLCERVCPILYSPELRVPLTSYAVVSKSKESACSASGGAFYELGKEILGRNGIVIGAAYEQNLHVKMIAVNNQSDLQRLQGSKYVRAAMDDIATTVVSALKENRWVLFAGTPCQAAAIRNALPAGVPTDKLVVADLICHGTPSNKLLKEYSSCLKKGTPICEIRFRNKKYGSKLIGSYTAGKREYPLFSAESSYYKLFLNGSTYGSNCYSCPFAQNKRVGDITLGDYWGIKQENPEFFSENNLPLTASVSAVMVNTSAGLALFDHISPNLLVKQVAYESITKHNSQLNRPVACPAEREAIEKVYASNGYRGIEKWFRKKYGVKRYSMRIRSYVPTGLKRFLINVVNSRNT